MSSVKKCSYLYIFDSNLSNFEKKDEIRQFKYTLTGAININSKQNCIFGNNLMFFVLIKPINQKYIYIIQKIQNIIT